MHPILLALLLLAGCAVGEALYYWNACGSDPWQCKASQQPKEQQ